MSSTPSDSSWAEQTNTTTITMAAIAAIAAGL
jgi:hypothetical protein